LKLIGIDPYRQPNFWGTIQEHFNKSSKKDKRAVVFIHGYNVSFREAALWAAQMGFDLSLRSPVAFFSWPSKGGLIGYSKDEAAIEASEAAVEQFLLDFVDNSGASALHVIAHSMGNRGLLRAISSIVRNVHRRNQAPFRADYFGGTRCRYRLIHTALQIIRDSC
jgi:esterase/lipase superfamily enzyme